MKKGSILILMSTYNGEKYLEEQIESIEKQECNYKLDILIRDDGSKDNTLKIIAKLNKKYKNIKVIPETNIGCNASFFKLFKLAKEEKKYNYYAISDQDDIWLPNKLQNGINELEKEKKDVPLLYGSCSKTFTGDGVEHGTTQKQQRELTLKNTIIQNIIPGHSQIFNYQLLELLQNDIDTNNIYVYDYWLTNLANLYGQIKFSNEPNTLYRVHETNTVGYGKSKLGWVIERLKRFNKGDGKKIVSIYSQNKR